MFALVAPSVISLCVGAYLGYTFAVRKRFIGIRLEKLTGLYDNLNKIIGMRERLSFPETLPDPFDRSIADSMASVIDPKSTGCKLCSNLKEPNRKFAELCRKTFRDSALLEDTMFLTDDVRKDLTVQGRSIFAHQPAGHDCDFLNISKETSKIFFERCAALRNKVEETINRLRRRPF